jgi:hypothetical protein
LSFASRPDSFTMNAVVARRIIEDYRKCPCCNSPTTLGISTGLARASPSDLASGATVRAHESPLNASKSLFYSARHRIPRRGRRRQTRSSSRPDFHWFPNQHSPRRH